MGARWSPGPGSWAFPGEAVPFPGAFRPLHIKDPGLPRGLAEPHERGAEMMHAHSGAAWCWPGQTGPHQPVWGQPAVHAQAGVVQRGGCWGVK